ncbi:MAG: GHKL domain-containing protein [Leptolyngbyaceae cyanobacterium SM2_3_12]|nr:GHKL domain-containing protein [Leptolyngbyaceae cyanobacterium SM2_3_12]
MLLRVKTHLQIRRLSQDLETKNSEIHHLTTQLKQRLSDLSRAQEELIYSEKMAALGQLTANIAHEINTPLGIIRAANANVLAAFHASFDQLPEFLGQLTPQQQIDCLELAKIAFQNQESWPTKEERQRRRQLEQELSAQGLADADFLANQLTLLRLDLDSLPNLDLLKSPHCSEVLAMVCNLVLQQQGVQSIQKEVDRAAKIVFALKTYSHLSNTYEQVLAPITDGLEVALTLYQNRFSQGIEVIRHYDNVPAILHNPDELTQVWVNLIDNALYAMGQQGVLEIRVTQQDHRIVVTITDSGCGIPIELQTRIFNPFFTTRPRGEGSGLGLDIVRQVVQKRGGDIYVSSIPGRTTFTLELPLPLDP